MNNYTHTQFLKQLDNITENQKQFIGEVKDNILNLFPNTQLFVERTKLGTLKPTGGVVWKYLPAYNLVNENFKIILNFYGKRSMEIHLIQTYNNKKGIGTKLMQIMNNASLETKTTLFLRPMVIGSTPMTILHKFYKKFGFKRTQDSIFWSNISIFQ